MDARWDGLQCNNERAGPEWSNRGLLKVLLKSCVGVARRRKPRKDFVERMSEAGRTDAAAGNLWRRVVVTWSPGGRRTPSPVTPLSQDLAPPSASYRRCAHLVPLLHHSSRVETRQPYIFWVRRDQRWSDPRPLSSWSWDDGDERE
jgi:hypothetical protein